MLLIGLWVKWFLVSGVWLNICCRCLVVVCVFSSVLLLWLSVCIGVVRVCNRSRKV